jgi:hypothetical protein
MLDRLRPWIGAILAGTVLAGTMLLGAVPPTRALAGQSVPSYDHLFLIVEENEAYNQIIGRAAAPYLNAYAKLYGLATNYFGVGDPSAPNYVAMIGGSTFGLNSDDPYYVHTFSEPNLISQLDDAHISWRGYFQGMPYPGYREMCYPTRCNGVPDFDKYYASKHNGIIYFRSVQNSPADMRRMVPLGQLHADLAAGNPPRFGYIVPDQCRDMHGSPPYCGDSGNPFDANDDQLVGRGDRLVHQLVSDIMGAPFWNQGNNAIFIVWDEGNTSQGCCDANPGTGRVASLVITSHGPRGLRDPTPYNHYSLLSTIEHAFGLGCIAFTCDTANVTPMAPLLAVGDE